MQEARHIVHIDSITIDSITFVKVILSMVALAWFSSDE